MKTVAGFVFTAALLVWAECSGAATAEKDVGYQGVQIGTGKDADGWTTFSLRSGAKAIYVSTSGNDSNDGLTQGAPKATVSAGVGAIADGAGDWLLFKRGDVWTLSSAFSITTTKKGYSAKYPTVIGAYGTGARPQFKVQNGASIMDLYTGIQNFAVVDLDFYCNTRDPADPGFNSLHDCSGINSFSTGATGSANILIEGNRFNFVRNNGIFADATHVYNNAVVRRNVMMNTWYVPGTVYVTSGWYFDYGVNTLVEENVFYKMGWNENITASDQIPQFYSHCTYFQTNSWNISYLNNVCGEPAFNCISLRDGGLVADNLCIRTAQLSVGQSGANRSALLSEHGETINPYTHKKFYEPQQIVVTRNVIIDPDNTVPRQATSAFDASTPSIQGHGMAIRYGGNNAVVTENIVAHRTKTVAFSWGGFAYELFTDLTDATAKGAIEFRNNIAYNTGPGLFIYNDNALSSVKIFIGDNVFNETRSAPVGGLTNPPDSTTGFYFSHWGTGASPVATNIGKPDKYYDSINTGCSRNHSDYTGDGGFVRITTFDPAAVCEAQSFSDPGRTILSYMTSIGETSSYSAFWSLQTQKAKGNYDARLSAKTINQYIRSGFNRTVHNDTVEYRKSEIAKGKHGKWR